MDHGTHDEFDHDGQCVCRKNAKQAVNQAYAVQVGREAPSGVGAA
jgi:hypothetical protein